MSFGLFKVIKRVIEKEIFLKKTFKISETIGVFGSKRSGTTWLMNIISELTRAIPIFEPFQSRWYEGASNYLPRPNDQQPGVESYLRNICLGNNPATTPMYDFNIQNLWNRYRRNKLTVKFVRGNSIIPLFTSLGVLQSVFIIRNPFAVISSQIRTGIQPHLISYYEKSKSSIEELLTLNWYADQQIPLRYNHERMFKVKYESLVQNPERVLMGLMSKLDIEYDGRETDKILNVDSRTTKRNIFRDRKNQLDTWKNELTPDQVSMIKSVLERVSFDYEEISFQY